MVFLSYAREDRCWARKLVQELINEGIMCLLDPDLVEGDVFWRSAIAQRISQCDLMVGLYSKHARASPWVAQEQRAFSGRRLWISIDPTLTARGIATKCPEIVPMREASSAIRKALPRRVGGTLRALPKATDLLGAFRDSERMTRIQQEQQRLEDLKRVLKPFSRRVVEIDGEEAQIDDGFIRLRRVDNKHRAYVSVSPVTNAQYRVFLDFSGYKAPSTWTRSEFSPDSAPVTGVSWFEAYAFAFWIGGALLSEEEWEAAGSGGHPTRKFSTANGKAEKHLACLEQPFGSNELALATAYPPNPEGYYGLCGNTWDWCATAWGPHRVIRGGGFMDSAEFCTIASRYRHAPIDRDCTVGFRVKVNALGI